MDAHKTALLTSPPWRAVAFVAGSAVHRFTGSQKTEEKTR